MKGTPLGPCGWMVGTGVKLKHTSEILIYCVLSNAQHRGVAPALFSAYDLYLSLSLRVLHMLSIIIQLPVLNATSVRAKPHGGFLQTRGQGCVKRNSWCSAVAVAASLFTKLMVFTHTLWFGLWRSMPGVDPAAEQQRPPNRKSKKHTLEPPATRRS
jgi:hypothetical protein